MVSRDFLQFADLLNAFLSGDWCMYPIFLLAALVAYHFIHKDDRL